MNLSQMTIDAKLEHWLSGLLDNSSATGIKQPSLIDPERRLSIVKALYEIVDTITAASTFSIGNVTNTQAYGVINVAAGNIGDFITFTLEPAAMDIPANTRIGVSHEANGLAGSGDGFAHVFFHRKDTTQEYIRVIE